MQVDWQQQVAQIIQDTSLQNTYTWEPFSRGSSNDIFLGRRNDATRSNLAETVILRLNAPTEETPGVDRQREANILNLIKPYEWAPKIISNHPKQGWCLMHHYDPVAFEPTLLKRLPHAQEQQLLKLMNALQAIALSTDHLGLQTDYQALLNETYLPIARQRRDALAQARIQSIKEDLSTLPVLPTCLVHHDIHVGNLVQSKSPNKSDSTNVSHTHLILLDWEYAALGNAWFDASCLSRYLSIPLDDIHALAIFKSLDKAHFKTALEQANRMTETLEKIWHWARE